MISKLTNGILDKVLNEVKQEHNIKKINSMVVDPVIHYCFRTIFPYLLVLIIIFILILVIAILILILLVKYSGNVNKLL